MLPAQVVLLASNLIFPPNLPAEETLKLGVIQGLTGIASEDGQNIVNAIKMAVEDRSANSQKIELLIEDDGTDPKRSVSAYHKLKMQGVHAIIGSTYGFSTEPIIPLAAADRIVLFNTSGLFEAFGSENSKGYFFSNANTIATDLMPFREFLTNSSYKRAVIISSPSRWGQVQHKAYSQELKNKAITILESIEPLQQDNNDWSSVLIKISAAAPDLLVLLLNKNDISIILRKLHELQISSDVYGSKNTFDALRLYHPNARANRVCYSYPRTDEKFSTEYFSKFAESPRVFAENSYDAVGIISEAFDKASATSTPLRATLETNEYRGISTTYRFHPRTSLAAVSSKLECLKIGSPKS